MLEFIKMFGLGILYTILFPLIVLVFALYLVYVFGNYLVMEALSIFGFFFGYTFSEETKLEQQLKEIKENGLKESKKEPEVVYEYDPSASNGGVDEGGDLQ